MRPGYLGGYLAEQLYTAYLALGEQAVEQEQPQRALDLYNKAAALQVPDNSEALPGAPGALGHTHGNARAGHTGSSPSTRLCAAPAANGYTCPNAVRFGGLQRVACFPYQPRR